MRTAIVIPTYNEAENLPRLAQRLLALDSPIDIVVVDDASPDGTGHVADEIAAINDRFKVIHRSGPRGYAMASKAGLHWGLDRGYEAVCTMDADLSHDPDVLPTLISQVEGGADVAIGSRYVEGGELAVDWGFARRAVSQLGSRFARAMIGTDVHDCTSGYRCYRSDTLARVDFDSIDAEGYCLLIEMLAALNRMGAVVVEVPITYTDRCAGASKISRGIIVEALARTTVLGARRLFGR
jgi:dolichol-phosphate mannosyltransferase